jgi:Uma2 family endonuclease
VQAVACGWSQRRFDTPCDDNEKYRIFREKFTMTVATNRRMTLEEYLEYEEDSDTRYALENGELVEVPSESDLNNLIAIYLLAELLKFVPVRLLRRGTEVAVSGYRITTRIPDLMVLSEELAAALTGARRSVVMPEMPPPTLVVEIVSPGNDGAARDYRYKRSEYAARGIAEYWIIDPHKSQITVLSLVSGLYEEAIFQGDMPLVSACLPDLKLTAAAILQAV